MKRNIKRFVLASGAIALLLLVACSEDWGLDNQTPRRSISSDYINFTTSLEPITASVTTRSDAGLLTIETEDWPVELEAKAETRGTPISSFSGSAGVIGYTTTSSTTTQLSSINDKEFSFNNEALTASANPVPWKEINTTDQLKVYAYAPYNFIDHGATPTGPTINTGSQNYPIITYASVPSTPSEQKDLIVANATATRESSEYNKTIDLNFSHALSAIRFKLGEGFDNCYAKSVVVQNVYGGGTYDFSTGAWTPTGAQNINYTVPVADGTVNYEEGDYLTTEANTLMMIPQTPGASTNVLLYYEETSGGTTGKYITATIPTDKAWIAGKRITYIINKTKPVTTIYFDLAADSVRIINDQTQDGEGNYTGFYKNKKYYGAIFDTDGVTVIHLEGEHNDDNKYYVYQTSSQAQRTAITWADSENKGKSTPSNLPSDSYTTYSLADPDDGQTKTWSDFITGNVDMTRATDRRDRVYEGWISLANNRSIIGTNNYVRICGNMAVDITIDNIYSLYPTYGSGNVDYYANPTTGTINIGPGGQYFNAKQLKEGDSYPSSEYVNRKIYTKMEIPRQERVTLRLKGDNRVQNIMYFGHHDSPSYSDPSYLKITSSEGDGSPKGTLTVYYNNGVSISGRAAIGGGYAGVNPPSNDLWFYGGTVFVGGSKSNNFEGVLGGGNGSPASLKFEEGCVVTSVASNNAAAIGGGGGLDAQGSDATIDINGGRIYAYQKGTYYSSAPRLYGSNASTAIGGGSSFSNKGGKATITMTGGEVYAESIGGTAFGGGSHLTMNNGSGPFNGGDAFIEISGGKLTAKSLAGKINGIDVNAGSAIGGGSGGTDMSGGNAGTDAKPMKISGGIVYAGSIGGGSIRSNNTVGKIGSANIEISGSAVVQGQFIMQAPDASTEPKFTMKGGTLQPNKAGDSFEYVQPNGGAVWIDGGKFTMSGGNIKDFSVSYNSTSGLGGLGGAVYMRSTVRASSFIMNSEHGGGTIGGCTATSESGTNGLGGAVYMSGGTFSMSGGTIGGSSKMSNQATNGGGAVYLEGGSFSMTGGSISYNRSTAGDGGGVYVKGGSFTMNNSLASIANNYAYLNGGGVNIVFDTDVSVAVTTGNITNNTAEKQGGGVYVVQSETAAGTPTATVTYGTSGSENTTTPAITYNNAGIAGGGLYAKGASAHVTLHSGKITNNDVSATVPNEDVANEQGSVTLYNTLVTKVTITFALNGGSLSSGSLTQNVAKGTNSLLVVPIVERQNFYFKGWKDNSGNTWSNGDDTSTIANDITLTAQWSDTP